MQPLVKLYIRHVFIGFLLALAFTGLLLWLNIGNLWHLITATSDGPLALLMLVIFNTIVFASVQFAIAIMGMAEDEDKPRGTRAPVTTGEPVKIAVGAQSGGNRGNRDGVNFPRA
jgi:hypothetical protein